MKNEITTKHDWVISTLVDLVFYSDSNSMDEICNELIRATVVISAALGRPVFIDRSLTYCPPTSAVIIPFPRREPSQTV